MIVVNILISIPLHRRFLVLTITYKLVAIASHPDEVIGAPPAAISSGYGSTIIINVS